MQDCLTNDYDIPEQPQDNIEELRDGDEMEEESVYSHENQVIMHKESKKDTNPIKEIRCKNSNPKYKEFYQFLIGEKIDNDQVESLGV